MRFATFNIHEFQDASGRGRVDDAIAVLKEVRCDVLILNEVGPDSPRSPLRDVGEALGMAVTFGKAGSGGNAVLTRQAPRDVQYFKLDEAVEFRSAIVVRVALAGAGASLDIDVVGVHFDHCNENERLVQLAALGRHLGARPVHLVGGDFNAMRFSDFDDAGRAAMHAARKRHGFETGREDFVRKLDESGYVDAVRLALAGSHEAYSGALANPIPAEHAITSRVETRIDYLVLSPALAPRVHAHSARTVVSDISDHNLVSVDLVLV
jgi:endonuclease/exonuclease/phosphatase family metal-dependent hydrolase